MAQLASVCSSRRSDCCLSASASLYTQRAWRITIGQSFLCILILNVSELGTWEALSQTGPWAEWTRHTAQHPRGLVMWCGFNDLIYRMSHIQVARVQESSVKWDGWGTEMFYHSLSASLFVLLCQLLVTPCYANVFARPAMEFTSAHTDLRSGLTFISHNQKFPTIHGFPLGIDVNSIYILRWLDVIPLKWRGDTLIQPVCAH